MKTRQQLRRIRELARSLDRERGDSSWTDDERERVTAALDQLLLCQYGDAAPYHQPRPTRG